MILEHPDLDSSNILPDGRFNHIQQIQERLRFLRYVQMKVWFMCSEISIMIIRIILKILNVKFSFPRTS